jgi:hypothetical protein
MAYDTLSAGVQQTEPILRMRISGFGGGGKPAERCRISALSIGLDAAREPPSGKMAAQPAAQAGEHPFRIRSRSGIGNPFRHGSRIASSTLRTSPRARYQNNDRVPTWISAVSVMPGSRWKFFGMFLRSSFVIATRAL